MSRRGKNTRILFPLVAAVLLAAAVIITIRPDVRPPVLHLHGADYMVLYPKEAYVEAGASATDKRDGDISDSVRTSGDIDTSRPGTFFVEYSVSDSAGNEAEARRGITVVERPSFLDPFLKTGLRESPSRVTGSCPPGRVVTVGWETGDYRTVAEAMEEASSGQSLFILLRKGTYTGRDLVIRGEVVIAGEGSETTVIQAGSSPEGSTGRIFSVTRGSCLELKDLTLRHGNPERDDRAGGAVRTEGTLILRNCVFRDNRGNCGGAVYSRGGTVAAEYCHFTGNIADGGNRDGRDCGSGGALKCIEDSTLLLYGCSFTGNSAAYGAGAVKTACSSEAVLVNCTIYGNTCRATGGGINSGGSMTVVHTTITGNSAAGLLRGGRRPPGMPAGGLYSKGRLRLLHSIIALNDGGDVFHEETAQEPENLRTWIGDGSLAADFSGDPGLMVPDTGSVLPLCIPSAGSGVVDRLKPEESLLRYDQAGSYRGDGSADLGSVEVLIER